MKKLLILPLFLFACNKKTNVQPTTTTQPASDVHCWYQVVNGVNLFYKCTSNNSEYIQTSDYCSSNQMNMVVVKKNTCSECQ